MLALPATAQKVVEGQGFDSLEGQTVYLHERAKDTDSTIVKGGAFRLENQSTEVDYARITLSGQRMVAAFWISPGDHVRLTDMGKQGTRVEGSQEEAYYQLYVKHMSALDDERKQILAAERAAMDAGDTERASQIADYRKGAFAEKNDSLFLVFADQYPRAYACLNHVYNRRFLGKMPFKRYSAMLAHLDTTAFHGEQWETLMSTYRVEQALEPGHPFPDIEMADIFGTNVKLSDFRGKYLLVTFTIEADKANIKSLPLRKELNAAYQERGLEQVDILFETNKDIVMKYAALNDIPWTILSDWKGWLTPLAGRLQIDMLPQNFLLDKKGNIVARNVWGDELKEAVGKCFAD